MQLSPLQSENLANSLKRHIAGEVLCDDYRRALYSTDASLYQIQPLAVVVPKSREDVAACVAIAAEHRVPLVARGSGTSLSGQSIGAGIVVDFSKYLNRIVDLDAARGRRASSRASCWISSTRPPPRMDCNSAPTWRRATARTSAA